MMKFIAGLVISLMLVSPVQARSFLAQNDSTKAWRLGVLVVPGMAYRALTILEESSFMHFIVDSRNGNEIPRLNYSGSLLLEHRFTNLFSVSGGTGYTVMGWQSEFSGFIFSDPVRPEGGSGGSIPDPAIPESVRYLQNFHYLDVPFRAQFTIGRGRFRSVTSIGITTSFLLRANTVASLTYSDGREDRKLQNDNAAYNKIGLFPTFSTGVSYALNDRMDLRLEPTFRYGVLRIIEAPITANLWSGGIGFGFHYGL